MAPIDPHDRFIELVQPVLRKELRLAERRATRTNVAIALIFTVFGFGLSFVPSYLPLLL